MRRLALTGGIGSGKSYVRGRFHALGVPTIDADALAREAVAPGTPGLEAVIARFGGGVLDAAGALDRHALGALVFEDAAARRDLEAIVHPAVRAATERWFAALDPGEHRFAIAEIPLLYEVGRDRDFDAVIVAACDPETQISRVMARDGITDAEVRQRLAAQMAIADKIARADHVIDTSGTREDTDEQVRQLFERLQHA